MSIDDELNRITDREGLCKSIREMPNDAQVVLMACYEHEGDDVIELQFLGGTEVPTAYWMAGHLQQGLLEGSFMGDGEEVE